MQPAPPGAVITRIGSDCGVDQKTVKAWLAILYFHDTGLAARLLGIADRAGALLPIEVESGMTIIDALEGSAVRGTSVLIEHEARHLGEVARVARHEWYPIEHGRRGDQQVHRVD